MVWGASPGQDIAAANARGIFCWADGRTPHRRIDASVYGRCAMRTAGILKSGCVPCRQSGVAWVLSANAKTSGHKLWLWPGTCLSAGRVATLQAPAHAGTKSLFKVFSSCALLCKGSSCKAQSTEHGTKTGCLHGKHWQHGRCRFCRATLLARQPMTMLFVAPLPGRAVLAAVCVAILAIYCTCAHMQRL